MSDAPTPDQRPAVLVNCPITDASRAALAPHFRLADTAEGAKIRAIISDGPRIIDKAMMDALPGLELIIGHGVGLDAIDLDEARRRGIQVANGRGTNETSVADHALALLLAVVRGVLPGDALMRARGGEAEGPRVETETIHGKRLGIIGLGHIGLLIAQRAEAFGMDILYHNRTARADVDYGYYASPLELAEAADHLVLSCPGGEGTRHLVNQDVLAALGPAGVLVNVARGSVVDTAALVGALQSGAIGGAGLDIIEGDGAALTHMDNVVMTPHLAGNTLEAGAAKDALTLAILIDFFAGREIMNRVV